MGTHVRIKDFKIKKKNKKIKESHGRAHLLIVVSPGIVPQCAETLETDLHVDPTIVRRPPQPALSLEDLWESLAQKPQGSPFMMTCPEMSFLSLA